MSKQNQVTWRSRLILFLMLVMVAALFISRFMLSISMAAFVMACFFHRNWRAQLRNFFSSPLLWGMGLLFFVSLLSGLWSDDKQSWSELVRIKLPLLLLPLAFAEPFKLTDRQWNLLSYFFILLVTAGTLWSLFHYAENPAAVNEGYLRAKTMITPLENDHVRFSLLVAVAILLTSWLVMRDYNQEKLISWLGLFIGFWLIIFLHILATRTGILALYLAAFLGACWLLIKKWKWQAGILMLIAITLLPVISWQVFPTFRNRVKYINYDFDYFKKASYRPGSNDAVRVISIYAGWEIMNSKPLAGEGYGDIRNSSVQWYDKNYPGMLPQDKIYPSSQLLMYGAGIGWPGLILFLTVMLLPFFMRVKNRLLWWQLNAMIFFSMLFDIGLEVQFGVFIYAFTVLWFYNLCKR
jgi:O-antigen ligase